LTKDNAQLTKDYAELLAKFKAAGLDTQPSMKLNTQPSTQSASTKDKMDANTTVISAIQTFCNTVQTIHTSKDTTAIQKQQNWLNAAKSLEAVLEKNRVTVSYIITNVTYEPPNSRAKIDPPGHVVIKVSPPSIKSNDRQLSNLVLSDQSEIRVFGNEAYAQKVSLKSSIIYEGVMHFGVEFDKPASNQPAFIGPTMGMHNPLSGSGYAFIGNVVIDEKDKKMTCPFYIKNTNSIKIDGVEQKLFINIYGDNLSTR
jgi:hypothetical protein